MFNVTSLKIECEKLKLLVLDHVVDYFGRRHAE